MATPRSKTTDAKRDDAIAQTIEKLDRLEPRSRTAKRIIAMLRRWLADESGYVEETWPILKMALDREFDDWKEKAKRDSREHR